MLNNKKTMLYGLLVIGSMRAMDIQQELPISARAQRSFDLDENSPHFLGQNIAIILQQADRRKHDMLRARKRSKHVTSALDMIKSLQAYNGLMAEYKILKSSAAYAERLHHILCGTAYQYDAIPAQTVTEREVALAFQRSLSALQGCIWLCNLVLQAKGIPFVGKRRIQKLIEHCNTGYTLLKIKLDCMGGPLALDAYSDQD